MYSNFYFIRHDFELDLYCHKKNAWKKREFEEFWFDFHFFYLRFKAKLLAIRIHNEMVWIFDWVIIWEIGAKN